ncbi:hypothetical protein LMG33818_000506 [Halomonadaceae bacterium LMG 33818]|uniref:SMP-30/gluconolactonase/LRE family protein n=1 Tax=Cernens ardua TaxID=3402176 RepID=UPI003EDC720B
MKKMDRTPQFIANRRTLLKLSGAALIASQLPEALAATPQGQVTGHGGTAFSPRVAGTPTDYSPLLKTLYSSNIDCNGVAVTADGKNVFLAFPRFGGQQAEYSVARLDKHGKVTPFPDNEWNRRGAGSDPRHSFVAVNAIHIFGDDTLWVVDQGSVGGKIPAPGAQKVVQLDSRTGKVLQVLRFSSEILPKGAQLNDLRIHGRYIFFTDSGLGGIVIHDQQTGTAIRRLSQQPIMSNDHQHPLRGSGGHLLRNAKGELPISHSNQIEVDPSGTWLYFTPLVGPLRKVRVRDLLDTRLDDDALAKRVILTFPIPSTNGTAMDSRGNLFVSDAVSNSVIVIDPHGQRETLVTDPRLISPDALFIDPQRNLYIPCGQVQYTAGMNHGKTGFHLPFYTFKMKLPTQLKNIPLGTAIA